MIKLPIIYSLDQVLLPSRTGKLVRIYHPRLSHFSQKKDLFSKVAFLTETKNNALLMGETYVCIGEVLEMTALNDCYGFAKVKGLQAAKLEKMVNGKDIGIFTGIPWTPLEIDHSKDKETLDLFIKLIAETNTKMDTDLKDKLGPFILSLGSWKDVCLLISPFLIDPFENTLFSKYYADSFDDPFYKEKMDANEVKKLETSLDLRVELLTKMGSRERFFKILEILKLETGSNIITESSEIKP